MNKENSDYVFTVFTPTYNRADLLKRTYESIKNQTFTNFEWLIVDDGSTDNTKEVVNSWIKENKIEIRYYYQTNSGKHVAINRGVKVANGELLFILDSDDWLPINSLENIYKNWKLITNQEKLVLSGVCGLCADKDGKIIGTKFPKDMTVSDQIEIRTFYDVKGDKCEVYITDVLKQFPFPENLGKFVTEALVWNRIAQKYKMVYINDIWEYKEYLPSGLTNKSIKLRVNNLEATILYYKEFCEIKNKKIKIKHKLKGVINYCRFSFHKKKIIQNFYHISGTLNKFLFIFLMPFSFLMYLRDKLKV